MKIFEIFSTSLFILLFLLTSLFLLASVWLFSPATFLSYLHIILSPRLPTERSSRRTTSRAISLCGSREPVRFGARTWCQAVRCSTMSWNRMTGRWEAREKRWVVTCTLPPSPTSNISTFAAYSWLDNSHYKILTVSYVKQKVHGNKVIAALNWVFFLMLELIKKGKKD